MALRYGTPAGDNDPLWYKDAVIYELHVRAFKDSNGDGIGDFRGLMQSLDYLQDLGVTALWLLPFYPSPLRDDGYDIADYERINPDYGDMSDFRSFLRSARQRGIRVITELVINHTSDQHPWFQRARTAKPGTQTRDFYVWSDTPDKYNEARVIFQDFETSNWTWDPVAGAYFWHRFYSSQPDLNFDNPKVRQAIFKALDHWLEMGVSGLRLDAIPYLFEREGTNGENLPETHAFLKELRRYVDERHPGRMLLSEANQWPEDAVAYFGDADESHMAFHFPLMPRLFMGLRMEDHSPIVDIIEQTPKIPEKSQWAIFLRNHDELTLEMVTDEERDYMYRMYAYDRHMRVNVGIRRRLAPLLNNNRQKMELLNALLFSLPGTPVIYYGDEIGMGDNFFLGDRNGVRTPMQWNGDRNAGFSRANPQSLYLPVIIDPEYHYETVNVDAQQGNPDSLLWWMRRIIGLRKRFRAFSRGSIDMLRPANRAVLAFIRRYENETILVVANLSRYAQPAQLDLSQFQGCVPRELFGATAFPPVGEGPYPLTLSPYGFYWFSLEPQRILADGLITGDVYERLIMHEPVRAWERLFTEEVPAALVDALVEYTQKARWFGGKAKRIRSTSIEEAIPVPMGGTQAYLVFLKLEYIDGEPETYILPVAHVPADEGESIRENHPTAIIGRLRLASGGSVFAALLYDAVVSPQFGRALQDAVCRRRHFGRPTGGHIVATSTQACRHLTAGVGPEVEPRVVRAEQSNSSIAYGDRLIFKLFRKLNEGVNPDLEIGRFLAERMTFQHVAPLAGAVEYMRGRGVEPATLGLLQGFVKNLGDAWAYTLEELNRYYDEAATRPADALPPLPEDPVTSLFTQEPPEDVASAIGPYLVNAGLIGRRTAELHLTLASGTDRSFAPEQYTRLHQRSLLQGIRNVSQENLRLLRSSLGRLSEAARADAEAVLSRQDILLARLQRLTDHKFDALRIRVHGDYHLGQVLYTGQDFIIIDFEGEPARPLSERRIKRSPLRDVAGMLRSFHYAANSALLARADSSNPGTTAALEHWGRLWYRWVAAAFFRDYAVTVEGSRLMPATLEDTRTLLDAMLIQKATYEVAYELNNRPDWVRIPLRGLLDILESD